MHLLLIQEYQSLIPAVFLTEGIDQTRGWAYTLIDGKCYFESKRSCAFSNHFFFKVMFWMKKATR